jgi:hypothetical protein
VVVVLSVYVPLASALKLPLTVKEPEIVELVQFRGSRPSHVGSRCPLTVRHDDFTFQVPTTLPPQEVPFWQEAPDPPVPVPPELPPVPDGLVPELALQAPEIIAVPMAIARTTD